jgi:fused signal recognition particle receptor
MKSLFKKIADGFRKTREVVAEGIQQVLLQHREIDEEFYDDLEAVLLRGDVGPATTGELVQRLRRRVKDERIQDPASLRTALRTIVEELLRGQGRPAADGMAAEATTGSDAGLPGPGAPKVILVVGVNGVGKTTSLAKLAYRAQLEGMTPLIVASDTFRAAASEQLEVWAARLGVQIVRSASGADPGAVAFDGIQAAQARGAGVVLIDTAGRLQTKGNLMEELKKIHRVCGKALPGAPHETVLVLDATIGQNAVSQAKLFSEAVPVDSILLAKLDGTSKGGVILAIAHELRIPVRYAGVGEKAEDLVDFDPALFAQSLVGESLDRAPDPGA